MRAGAGEQGRGDAEAPPQRAAVAMVVIGGVLLGLAYVLADERWRAAALILGGLVGGVGLLTVAYGRVEPHLPVRRKGGHRH